MAPKWPGRLIVCCFALQYVLWRWLVHLPRLLQRSCSTSICLLYGNNQSLLETAWLSLAASALLVCFFCCHRHAYVRPAQLTTGTVTAAYPQPPSWSSSSSCSCFKYGGFPKLGGYHFGGPNSKDYSILGSILGYPFFWETTKKSVHV